MSTAAAAKTTSKIVPAGSKAPSSRTVSSPDKVVDAINKGILARRFGVGHRLVEADLANSLNVSRGTVREALKKLSGLFFRVFLSRSPSSRCWKSACSGC